MYVQVTSSIYGDVATFTAFRRETWATVIAIGVLTNINESSQQYDIVNKEKINSSFFHVFSKIFIKKVNLNNKYLKIIKHLLDKIEGVLDAKSIFRLKRSSHSQFFYEIATLTIPTESSGKCATWSLFFKTDLHGCCFTGEVIPPDDCTRLYYYERIRLHFKN